MLGRFRLGVAFVVAAGLARGAEQRPSPLQAVPLGGGLSAEAGDRQFGVYVPTRFGGTLTVEASSGAIGPIIGPDGRERLNGEDTGPSAPGWYTFQVRGAAPGLVVSTSFVQVGRSARRPWNFYYWPTKS